MAFGQSYQKVPEGEDFSEYKQEDEELPPPTQSPWYKKSLLVSLAAGTLVAAVVAVFATIHTSSTTPTSSAGDAASTSATPTSSASAEPFSTPTHALEILDCGSNPEEARALDCVYDVMMQLWTPRPCYDAPLTERFLAAGNWTWWADSTATTTMTDEVMALGEHSVVYTSPDYHKMHCVFAGEKLVRALRTQKPIIEQLISYDHAIHCRHKALAAADAKGAIAPRGFTKCAMYEVWLDALPENRVSSDS